MKRAICVGAALLAASCPAAAQTVDLNALIPAGGATASGRIIELVAILTVLSVAPGLLIMVTSFTRFIVALSFLRSGLGLQSAPANLVLISLSLFMTFFVMAPTFDRAWQNGPQAADGQSDQPAGRPCRGRRAVSGIHAQPGTGKGYRAVRGACPKGASTSRTARRRI